MNYKRHVENELIEELRWRGLLHTISPGTEEQLSKEMTTGYSGFDPTADSLHIGSLVPIILLKHFQDHGHKPIALLGGATGMIGDPSGKSKERTLMTEEQLNKNLSGIQFQLDRFLDFHSGKKNDALLLNNYEWTKNFSFLDFARKIGKHITINYMMAKDSVKQRLLGDNNSEGLSFAEFTYQLLQGFDFLHLYKEKNCKLQMGGSDQWGNMTTGMELIRRKEQGEAFVFTCPLTTKGDGSKFGKSETGENIWLDIKRTSPYKFYQFWINQSDEDAEKYIKIYTFLPKDEIEKIIFEHRENPHARKLQKILAKEITIWVHGEKEFENAVRASDVLFGKATNDDLNSLSANELEDIFEGVPQAKISIQELEKGIPIIDFLSEKTKFLPSKSETRRALKQNAISINKIKTTEGVIVNKENLISNQFIVLQRGKKNYCLVRVFS